MSQDAPSSCPARRLGQEKDGDHNHLSTVLGNGSGPANIEHWLTAEESGGHCSTPNTLEGPEKRLPKLVVPRKTGKQLCSICSTVPMKRILQPSPHCFSIDLGSIEDIFRRSHCPLCRVVFDILLKWPAIKSTAPVTEPRMRQTCVLERVAFDRKPEMWVVYGEQIRGYVTISMDSSSFKIGPADLDVGTVKSWLRECNENHPNCDLKSRVIRYHEPLELLLIDVIENRVTPAWSTYRYLALSYVRGGVEIFQFLKENEQDLQQHGALLTRKDDIAPVVQDAMELVSALGERYLWVDCLCIVQDDDKKKHHQIARMDIIYSQAFLTIVALSGDDAQARLPGVRPNTRMPVRTVEAAEVTNSSSSWGHSKARSMVYFGSNPPDLDLVIDSVPYETRGWTFQERLLSRRCLYITDHQVYFQCPFGHYSEAKRWLEFDELTARVKDMTLYRPQICSAAVKTLEILHTYRAQFNVALDLGQLHLNELCNRIKSERHGTDALDMIKRLAVDDSSFESRNHKTSINPLLEAESLQFSGSSNPEKPFTIYTQLVSKYTQRKLSFPTDVLNAFNGITSVLEHSCNTSFAYGLPEALMDIALLWMPAGPVSRRLIPAARGLQSMIRFPSWSWAGWVGPVKYSFNELGTLLEINSKIRSVFLEDQSCVHLVHRIDSCQPDEEVSCADAKVEPFRLPIPTSLSGVLHFKAFGTTAQNFLIPEVLDTSSLARNSTTPILDIQRRRCGKLYNSGSLSSASLQDRSCEFILLSQTVDYVPRSKDVTCKLNLMLIEWKGELAERLAIGQMCAEVWWEARPERKHIRLV